ncbi:hypothetical protein A2899_00180 [Candidatus Amesbacteria bacterium RIFCSPLOWO2_01_FULL_49_25]|uniref:Uncharacterized protein n=1 Tax=Candidatus Amesbacteria bacterium RIFCSPHIGHO2_01_FULL_48_32b TaxID=1797253 RepID=A0A1F4YGY4_9BACT|nr:MAG: hypothetical protein A2876_04925 [Candidatus Amesbacteria bacterium RIFCSPHIGHO2_01_FULL_48_32b]OGD07039.1 MAG: hypothetical protein A2899_00180 [Candidatus Amesbacteria bacterium RIFCSPLOWO2_01_FULL_49_25]
MAATGELSRQERIFSAARRINIALSPALAAQAVDNAYEGILKGDLTEEEALVMLETTAVKAEAGTLKVVGQT